MIESTGGMDYGCTGAISDTCMPTAHSECDTGGEFVAAYQTALWWDDPDAWVVPVGDLLGIYLEANITDVTADAIDECAVIFWVGAQGIKDLAGLVAPLEELPAPFFAERYVDFPAGGLDDMALWTGRMWERWIQWVENGCVGCACRGERGGVARVGGGVRRW